jgi:co-chaperonin GroES (HSP10)
MLRPLGNSILFAFVDDHAGGNFIPKTKSGILLTNQNLNEAHVPKWAKVLAIGPDVDEQIKVGLYILIEPLKWTIGFKHENVQIWKTDDTQVMLVDDEPHFSY